MIDDVMAKHLFPGQDPVGREINMFVIGTAQVVGVIGHVKHFGLDGDATAKIRNEMYFPFGQIPDKYMPEIVVGANLLARTAADPLGAVSAVRAQVAGPTNDQPMYAVDSNRADHCLITRRAPLHHARVDRFRLHRPGAGLGGHLWCDVLFS